MLEDFLLGKFDLFKRNEIIRLQPFLSNKITAFKNKFAVIFIREFIAAV
jgi:hypothetical protein